MGLSTIPGLSQAAMQDEIKHLLNYVQSTQCIYERNGDMHSGEEAVEHIEKKYAYFSDDIESAEDFIKYAATKSTFSGKHYKIHCEDKTSMSSSEWLLSELARYRQNQALPTQEP